ncbi:MAG: glutamate 5-kinase [Candidatus Latescibacterota bacterium]|jgi:glutamate 5-kinase
MAESGAKGRGRERLRQAKRLVVKIGSSSLTTPDQRLDRRVLRQLVADVVELRRRGVEVAVVTSGAVAAGMGRLGMKSRPRGIADLQAAAAVGQNLLMNAYESLFRRGGVPVGQVLLTADDILDDRRRYLNLKNTFSSLFALGAVPIINENDSVAVAELKRQIGENDMLAAYVTSLVEAQLLVILSDVEGLYRGWEGGPAGELIREVHPGDDCLAQGGGTGSGVGSGGIETKLRAARLVMACGEMAVIAHARRHRLVEIADGAEVGTLFVPAARKLTSRKRWIAFASACRGRLIVDRGAQRAITQQDRSLLPAGVVACEGEFAVGDAVRVESEDRQELARGLSRYGAAELRRVLGKRTAEVTALLGKPAVEVIHRDDLVLLC